MPSSRSEIAVPSGVGGHLALAGFAVCTCVGLLFASHFRLYYGIEWTLALWWGLKDWYLWGLLAPLAAWVAWRAPLSGPHWPRSLAMHLGAAFALAWIHPALAISLSAVAEGLSGASWAEAVQGLFLKRYAVSLLTYAAIVGIAHVLASRWGGGRPSTEVSEPTARPRAAASTPVERLLVRKGDREKFLEVERIVRVEAEGNYVRLHLGDGAYLERRTLRSLEAQLDAARFLRIHRSHLVNVDRVDRIEAVFKGGYEVVLDDGSRLPLSRTYRRRLEARVGETL